MRHEQCSIPIVKWRPLTSSLLRLQATSLRLNHVSSMKNLDNLRTCPQCGSDLAGPFCSQCGQDNTHQRLHTKDVLKDVAGHFLTFDSKVFRTVSGLMRNPGRISLEYVQGKRQSYLSPFKFYVTVSALFFLITRLLQVKYRIDISLAPSSRLAQAANEMSQFLTSQLDYVVVVTLPLMAIVFRLVFRKSKYNFAETFVFLLYVTGVGYILQVLITPFARFASEGLIILGFLLRFGFLICGSVVFYQKKPLLGTVQTVLALFLYVLLTGSVAIAIGYAIYFCCS